MKTPLSYYISPVVFIIVQLEFTHILIEIVMLAYTVAFKIFMIGGKLVESIIEASGKLGLKSKKEDTVGRVLKGLSDISTEKFGIYPNLSFQHR